MKTSVVMPSLGYDMDQGTIAAWLKQVGDRVERGDVLAEIETDKATVEMEALASGTLVEVLHGEGATVAVGDVIAYLEAVE